MYSLAIHRNIPVGDTHLHTAEAGAGPVLVFFHGLSHGDLARHLQQPLGTVKAWVRRGLARLASCLTGND